MRLSKGHVVRQLRAQGRPQAAQRAARTLPDEIDTVEHRDALEQLGVDIRALTTRTFGAGDGTSAP